jgi:secondary thiamine-phosphate synthase enzyme
MKTFADRLQITTAEAIQIVDVTERVTAILSASGIRNGLATLISNHTTAFVALNESEPRLQQDMIAFLASVAPPGAGYGHDVSPVDDRANAHAHLAGLLMSGSESIPIVDGRPLLGRWQSILFVELDGPREGRTLHVHVLGESLS